MHWWHEALHGVYWPGSGKATSWPQVIGVAASFNRSLFAALGELTGTEGRAMCGTQSDYWSPNINLLREPLWGRGQETPGEDPVLNSECASTQLATIPDMPTSAIDDLVRDLWRSASKPS